MNGNPFAQLPTTPFTGSLSVFGVGSNYSANKNPASNPLMAGDIDPIQLYKTLLAQNYRGARIGGTTEQQGAERQLRASIYAPGSEFTDKTGGLNKFDGTLSGSSSRLTSPVTLSKTNAGGTSSQLWNTFGGIQNGDITSWNPKNLPVVPYSSGSRSTNMTPPNVNLPTLPKY